MCNRKTLINANGLFHGLFLGVSGGGKSFPAPLNTNDTYGNCSTLDEDILPHDILEAMQEADNIIEDIKEVRRSLAKENADQIEPPIVCPKCGSSNVVLNLSESWGKCEQCQNRFWKTLLNPDSTASTETPIVCPECGSSDCVLSLSGNWGKCEQCQKYFWNNNKKSNTPN